MRAGAGPGRGGLCGGGRGERTGYFSAAEAAAAMGCRDHVLFLPDAANSACYQELYREYCQLYDYFGKGGNGVMERLYERKHSARQRAIEKKVNGL